LISQRFIAEQFWKRFHYKFFLSLHHHYSKADHYAEIVSLIKKVIEIQEHRISRLSEESIRKVCDYLEIQARFYRASDMINDKVSQSLSVNARLIELTKIAGGHSYINPIAGQHLYQPDDFSAAGVELYFLSAIETDYKQGATENFIPSLSIIDLLMHNNKKTIINMLSQAKVIKASTLS